MSIKDYLRKYKVSVPEFAMMVGSSQAAIYRYLKGEKMHRNTARRIERGSGGEIKEEELAPYE